MHILWVGVLILTREVAILPLKLDCISFLKLQRFLSKIIQSLCVVYDLDQLIVKLTQL